MNFIKNFSFIQSNYCSRNTKTRQYLSSDHSCRQMLQYYIAELSNKELIIKMSFSKEFLLKILISASMYHTPIHALLYASWATHVWRKKCRKKHIIKRNLSAQKKIICTFFDKIWLANNDELVLVLSYNCQNNLVL